MLSKIKNIIIFIIIAAILILAYVFFIRKSPEQDNLISFSPVNTILPDTNNISNLGQVALDTQDLLSVLLSVKDIKLNDAIFSDQAFLNLNDSTIILTSPGDEGRPNPFAPIGYDFTTIQNPQDTGAGPALEGIESIDIIDELDLLGDFTF